MPYHKYDISQIKSISSKHIQIYLSATSYTDVVYAYKSKLSHISTFPQYHTPGHGAQHTVYNNNKITDIYKTFNSHGSSNGENVERKFP